MKKLFVIMLTICMLLAGCQKAPEPTVPPMVTDSPAVPEEGPLDLPTPELPGPTHSEDAATDPLLGPEGLPTPEL